MNKFIPESAEATIAEPSADTASDPSPKETCAPTTPQSDDEVIARLAAMKPLEYERVRVQQAKQMGCRPATLDALVKVAREEDGECSSLPFAQVEPCAEQVDPAQLLDEMAATFRRFVVMRTEETDAAALWTAHTWFIDVVEVAPLVIINAPEKACGKSQLLDVIGRMSARPLPVANATTASLFRSVELWRPTLLIDEADTFVRNNEELMGLINAGHTRANAFVLRVVGDNHEPRMFKVWGAKALAGIALEKRLPDATMSRAIVINLRRKLPHESVMRLRHVEAGLFEGISSRLARFAEDYSQQVRLARPDLPDALGDRAQDNWEPVLAIAECAGAEWVQRATAAALELSGANEEGASICNELLADIRDVFADKQIDKIKSADLIDALEADEERPWATYNRGKPLTPRQLARHLSGYGIRPKTVRFGNSTPKGYERAQFTDAFARYLAPPGGSPKRRNEPPETNGGEAGGVSDAADVAATPDTDETQGARPPLGRCGVADNSPDADGACPPESRHSVNPEDTY